MQRLRSLRNSEAGDGGLIVATQTDENDRVNEEERIPELSYEDMRQRNMQRNEEMLKQLGLLKV